MASVHHIRRVWILLGLLGFLLTAGGCESFLPQPHYPPPPPPPVAAPPTPSRPAFFVNASRLNLRACPGMDCPKVATLERNEEVEKVAETEDWIQVRVKRDGSIGWVASRYLSGQPVPPEAAPATPSPIEPPAPEVAWPERPPPAEKPKPVKPTETHLPKPTPKPAEAAEPKPKPVTPSEPEPAPEKPAPPAPPAPVEKPVPAKPQPEPEPPKTIRIM